MSVRRVIAAAARCLVAASWLTAFAVVPALGASPDPIATSIGGGIGGAVGIGPPVLGLLGVVGGILVLGRLPQRRWPGP